MLLPHGNMPWTSCCAMSHTLHSGPSPELAPSDQRCQIAGASGRNNSASPWVKVTAGHSVTAVNLRPSPVLLCCPLHPGTVLLLPAARAVSGLLDTSAGDKGTARRSLCLCLHPCLPRELSPAA